MAQILVLIHKCTSCSGQNLTTPSKLGYLDMDVSGKRKADQQSSKLSLGQGNGSRRITLHPGTLHSMLQNEPSAEQRERVHWDSTFKMRRVWYYDV